MSELLEELAARIAAVSPAWAEALAPRHDAVPFVTSAAAFEPRVALGIEAIREGWLLHRDESRLAPGIEPDMALLIGDWCYAAGLGQVSEHGTLDQVAPLAALVADVSARAGEPRESLEPSWSALLA